jgi:hypothetical protein
MLAGGKGSVNVLAGVCPQSRLVTRRRAIRITAPGEVRHHLPRLDKTTHHQSPTMNA